MMTIQTVSIMRVHNNNKNLSRTKFHKVKIQNLRVRYLKSGNKSELFWKVYYGISKLMKLCWSLTKNKLL